MISMFNPKGKKDLSAQMLAYAFEEHEVVHEERVTFGPSQSNVTNVNQFKETNAFRSVMICQGVGQLLSK